MHGRTLALIGWISLALGAAGAHADEIHGAVYRVLPGQPGGTLPFLAVTFQHGAMDRDGVSWRLSVYEDVEREGLPLLQVQARTNVDPLRRDGKALEFQQYILRLPRTQEAYEYVHARTGRPLLPPWDDFGKYFVPFAAMGSEYSDKLPHTARYLGHVLTLYETRPVEWEAWPAAKRLELNPDLLVGTGRSVRDREGHRLPQEPERTNYDYVSFTPQDYEVMFEAGMNVFLVGGDQQRHVQGEPVFFLRGFDGEDPTIQYPGDFYRANYLGDRMYKDEPSVRTIGDKRVHDTLRHFADAAALFESRVRSRYTTGVGIVYGMERHLQGRGVALGDMRLAQYDIPAWETVFHTAYYQLKGGLSGIVHEGRYDLEEFNELARASTGLERDYTADEMLRYHYAFLRGAARRFDKHWGTSIYGQADPAHSPMAIRLAYDMGARYVWFWTSDHDHHLPWPEQLELARVLRDHAAAHPRESLRDTRRASRRDALILIPYGYFLNLESDTGRRADGDLWWVREMDPAGQNEASQRYRALMTEAFEAVGTCLDRGWDFDISIDDGERPRGYRRVIRLQTR